MTVITAKPFTARPFAARPFTAYPFGESTSVSNPLVWHAAYPDADGVMQAQLIGSGTPSFTVDDGLLLPDHEGVYVAISEDTPPWHGARWVDGVAYGTDGSGDPLDPLPSLYGAPAYTNSATYSNDLTNAVWTASNVTVAKDANGLTGAPNTACTLTATAGNGTVIRNAITAASGTHTTQWHIKRKTGTGTIEITVDNGTTWQDVTSLIDSSTFNECLEGLTVTNPQIGIRIVTSGDAVYVGNAACHLSKSEAACRGSSPIITAASTVTTTAISMSYDIANFDAEKGAYYAESYCDEYLANQAGFISVVPQSEPLFLVTKKAASYATTAGFINGPGSLTDGAYNKIAVTYSLSEAKARVTGNGSDGELKTNYAGFRTPILSGLEVLNGADNVQLIRNIRRYNLNYDASKAKITELMT